MRSRWLRLEFALFLVLLVAGFGPDQFIGADSAIAAPSPAYSADQAQSASVDSPKPALTYDCFLPSVGIVSRDDSAQERTTKTSTPAVEWDQNGGQPPSVPANPPVPGQGGTCIAGRIIDRYHQQTGAGWKVTVTSGDGVLYEQTANANGAFRFNALGAGTWTVALEIPQGWRSFTSASFPVTLSGSGDQCANVRFKVEALACLELTKLEQSGHTHVPIAGWEMTASHGDTTLKAVTDWQGRCRFENLVPGTWTVEEESKLGWAPVGTPIQTINLYSPRIPGVCQPLTFKNRQVYGASIDVFKVDTNGNPLAGWSITLDRPDGTHPSVSGVTNSSGYTSFSGLAPGDWIVQEQVKAWWRPIGPTQQAVTLPDRGSHELVVFENEPLGCVDGYKINHLGQGLAGWKIVARNDDGTQQYTAVTNDRGYFQFMLPLDGWTISETVQTGWEPVTPPELHVDVTQPFVCEHIRFKNETKFACLDVFKQDATDGAGLPDWQITVQPAYGGTPISGWTDGTGHIRFNGLMPGTYIVSEQLLTGWLPIGSTSRRVTLHATGQCEVVTFRNVQESAQPIDDPPATACRAYHKVCWCDTLFSIAQRYGTTVAAIKQANGLIYDTIYVGQTLCIP